jgi:hypothetical protein
VPEIERATYLLMNHAASLGCQIAMIEIADGLQQLETAQLVRSEAIRRITIGTVFAAYDAMGAKYGVDLLREAGHAVLAMSGRLGRSPLGVREAELATGLKVYTPYELQEGALVPAIRERARELNGAIVFSDTWAGQVSREYQPSEPAEEGNGLFPMQTHRRTAASAEVRELQQGGARQGERTVLSRVAASLMQAEVARICGAPFRKRAQGRSDRRNGFRSSTWESAIGPVPVRIPRLRRGRYRPAFLAQPGEKLEDALNVLIGAAAGGGDEASVSGALTKLVAELSGPVLDESQVRELAAEIQDLLDDLAAGRTLRLVAGVQRSEGFADCTGSWIAIADPSDDEAGSDSEGPEEPGRVRRTVPIDLEEEDRSTVALFQAPHAIAGE